MVASGIIGLGMILLGIHMVGRKVPLPRPPWVIIVGAILIFSIRMLLAAANAPIWFLSLPR